MAEILKTINGEINTNIGSTGVDTLDGLIHNTLFTKDKIVVVTTPTGDGYANTVMGVSSGNISTVMGLATANISKVMGV
tara:strand:- start:495 stop:731 length:237 start_codon:yes stop_codon:yes gene_type:complete